MITTTDKGIASGTTGNWVDRLGSWSLAARVSVLILVALVLFAVVSPIAFSVAGVHGVVVSACALAICLGGMLAALITGDWLVGERWAIVNVIVGMVMRMALPLGAFVVVQGADGSLAQGGFGYNLLVYYPALLAAETLLNVARLRHSKR